MHCKLNVITIQYNDNFKPVMKSEVFFKSPFCALELDAFIIENSLTLYITVYS